MHFRSYRPLRQRIEKHRAALQKLGFSLVEGSDEGWFGDGRYVFGAGRLLLRITRSRGEEFVELALQRRPAEEEWFDLFELLTAFGVLTSRDVLDGRAMAHDLDSKLPAYIELSAKVDAELARDQAALERRLQQARADGQRVYSERLRTALDYAILGKTSMLPVRCWKPVRRCELGGPTMLTHSNC